MVVFRASKYQTDREETKTHGWPLVFVVSFRTGAAKYKNLEDSIFIASKTVKSLGSGGFRAGLRISTVYLTKTDITLN